jgi:hypothetical protein
MRPRILPRVVALFGLLLPFTPLSAVAEEPHVTGPLTYGNLAIYFVHGPAAAGAVPQTLEDAIAKGQVKVHETGSVNDLNIENIGDHEVFVQAGDIVKGGRQDRVLSVDLLLPPRSGLVSIAAFCVEPERWTARGAEDPTKFSSSTHAMPSHDAMLEIQSYAGTLTTTPAAPAPNPSETQVEVWSSVRTTQDKLARSVGQSVKKSASPSSLQLSLENEKLKQAEAAYVTALQSGGETGDDIVGYVYVINGKIKSADVYMSNAFFRTMWRKLLAANVTEAIGEGTVPTATQPSLHDVQAFLAGAQATPKSERNMNASVRLVVGQNDHILYTESRRADDNWLHRKYVAK